MNYGNALERLELKRDRAELEEIKQRIDDYKRDDLAARRAELIALWREAHPEAAKETSARLKPLMKMEDFKKSNPDEPDEIWFNDVYHVTLRRKEDRVFGTRQGMIQLGINTHDGTARHDWREFQAIKSQLCGLECEGFELYPAESRLVDPSNYYSLWCFPGLKRLKVGIEQRRVLDAAEALAPQRALPADTRTPV